MTLYYNGSTLKEDFVFSLISHAKKMGVVPSFLITLLHYESMWGSSEVAKLNNNWAGMTWTGNPQRPSGVVVTRGSARPAKETGYYMRYESTDDFLTDWTYLLRRGGSYKVADSSSFDDAVRGMFRYGGALYDYAIMGVPDSVKASELRFDKYLKGMQARRSAINSVNAGALDLIDKGESIDMSRGTVQAMIAEAQKMIGVVHGSSAYNKMVKDYNDTLAWAMNNAGLNPKPRNVNLSSNPNSGAYDWCAGFISVIAERSGNIPAVGFEIAAERLGKYQHQSKGTWLGRLRPKAGDLVLFRWTGAPGWADHIGLVESVLGDTVNTIEGNINSPRSVRRRAYNWNDYRITGYARPKYKASTAPVKSNTEIAQEVVAGLWGNGSERVSRLTSAGYSPSTIQAEVNKLMTNQAVNLKTTNEIAKEILEGKWGNNPERSKKLIEAGYDVNAVQKVVNELLKQPEENEVVDVVEEEPKNVEVLELKRNQFEIDGRVYEVKELS